eukprot:scaffold109_cov252-Pinguiococcus_pyrenoidosus.AAC.98
MQGHWQAAGREGKVPRHGPVQRAAMRPPKEPQRRSRASEKDAPRRLRCDAHVQHARDALALPQSPQLHRVALKVHIEVLLNLVQQRAAREEAARQPQCDAAGQESQGRGESAANGQSNSKGLEELDSEECVSRRSALDDVAMIPALEVPVLVGDGRRDLAPGAPSLVERQRGADAVEPLADRNDAAIAGLQSQSLVCPGLVRISVHHVLLATDEANILLQHLAGVEVPRPVGRKGHDGLEDQAGDAAEPLRYRRLARREKLSCRSLFRPLHISRTMAYVRKSRRLRVRESGTQWSALPNTPPDGVEKRYRMMPGASTFISPHAWKPFSFAFRAR